MRTGAGTRLRVVSWTSSGSVNRDALAACQELAPAAGPDVLHPVGVGAVGEGDHVAAVVAEDVDRSAVARARGAACVEDDAEAGELRCERAREPVRDSAVEMGYSGAEGHRWS